MNNELVLSRFYLLPENLRFQVLEYIEFLLHRHTDLETNNSKTEQDDEQISPELKKLLEERMKGYEENPEKACTWEEVKEKLNEKYSYGI